MDDPIIVADANIPRVREAFDHLGSVRVLPGEAIDRAAVREAEALLVRSVTRVDRSLLEGSSVRFVGSATSGTDHVDRRYLERRGVTFAHAPGSNAESVVEYVLAALLLLGARRETSLAGRSVGVIGCGAIGSRLLDRLPAWDVEVLPNDPPRAEEAERRGEPHPYLSLDRVVAEADVLTLHVPLVTGGRHPTRHLVDAGLLARLSSGAWLINASRGGVVDDAALADVLVRGGLAGAVIDTWEHEPDPLSDLLERCDLATPHVAGYSYDGKIAGTWAIYRALCVHWDREERWDVEAALELEEGVDPLLEAPAPGLPVVDWAHRIVRQVYDVEADDRKLRRILDRPPEERGGYFAALRRGYSRRRAFGNFRLAADPVPEARRDLIRTGLGMTLTDRASA